MTQKIKKKTVKELNEDLILMENKLLKFEKIVDCLTAKIETLVKQNRHIPNIKKIGPEHEKRDANEYDCKKCD